MASSIWSIHEDALYTGFTRADFVAACGHFLVEHGYRIDRIDSWEVNTTQRGTHLNFKPQIDVKFSNTQNGVMCFFHSHAHLQASGVVAGLFTGGLTAVVGAGTFTVHYNQTCELVRSFWRYVDSIAIKPGTIVSVNHVGPKGSSSSGSGRSGGSSSSGSSGGSGGGGGGGGGGGPPYANEGHHPPSSGGAPPYAQPGSGGYGQQPQYQSTPPSSSGGVYPPPQQQQQQQQQQHYQSPPPSGGGGPPYASSATAVPTPTPAAAPAPTPAPAPTATPTPPPSSGPPCTGCGKQITDPTWVVCPWCAQKTGPPTCKNSECGETLDPRFKVCPYCATPQQ